MPACVLRSITALADEYGVCGETVKASSANATFNELSSAFKDHRVNTQKVSRRTVRSSLQLLDTAVGGLRKDLLDNPFQPPHSLEWFLGLSRTPVLLTKFLKLLSKPTHRVWSVAKSADGSWEVLVQVHGFSNPQKQLTDEVNLLESQLHNKFTINSVIAHPESLVNVNARQPSYQKLSADGFFVVSLTEMVH